jgi:hypothetical protein
MAGVVMSGEMPPNEKYTPLLENQATAQPHEYEVRPQRRRASSENSYSACADSDANETVDEVWWERQHRDALGGSIESFVCPAEMDNEDVGDTFCDSSSLRGKKPQPNLSNYPGNVIRYGYLQFSSFKPTERKKCQKKRLVVLSCHCLYFGNRRDNPKASFMLDRSVQCEMAPIEQGRCTFEITAGRQTMCLASDNPEDSWAWVESISNVVANIENMPRGLVEIQCNKTPFFPGRPWVRRFAMIHANSLTIHSSADLVHYALEDMSISNSTTISMIHATQSIRVVCCDSDKQEGRGTFNAASTLTFRPIGGGNDPDSVLTRVWAEAIEKCRCDVEAVTKPVICRLSNKMENYKLKRISKALRRWLLHVGKSMVLEEYDTSPLDSKPCELKSASERHTERYDSTKLANLMNCCSRQLRLNGKLQEATTLMRRALHLRERAVGKCHPGTARSLNNLALILDMKGEYSEAEVLYRRALDINTQHLGPVHSETATVANNLASVLFHSGRYEESENLYQYAYQICIPCFGPNHKRTRSCKRNQLVCEQLVKRACITVVLNGEIIRKNDVDWAPSVFTSETGGASGSPTRKPSSTTLVQFRLKSAEPLTAHTDLSNSSSVRGCACLVKRGLCTFTAKVMRAAKAGAAAVVVINQDDENPEALLKMGSIEGFRASIPVIIISQQDGRRLHSASTTGNSILFEKRRGAIQQIWYEACSGEEGSSAGYDDYAPLM